VAGSEGEHQLVVEDGMAQISAGGFLDGIGLAVGMTWLQTVDDRLADSAWAYRSCVLLLLSVQFVIASSAILNSCASPDPAARRRVSRWLIPSTVPRQSVAHGHAERPLPPPTGPPSPYQSPERHAQHVAGHGHPHVAAASIPNMSR
jgi:hypothetical protein